MATKKKHSSQGSGSWITEFLLKAASNFGVSGATILSIIVLFFVYGTEEQKREFIDRFVLLKILTENKDYAVFVIVLFVILLISQSIYYFKRNKLKDERIKQLEEDLDKLQNKLLRR